MTLEKAIEFGKIFLKIIENEKGSATYEFVEMAVKMMEKEPCEDAISRQAVLEITAETGALETQARVKALPPVTQEPKTGHWVEENINEWSRKVFCSECGCPPPFEYVSNGDVYSASGYGVINKTKHCPNCGAKMVEPQESEE